MRITRTFVAAMMVTVLGAVLACGGDGTGPATSRNNPGTGTSTLHVDTDIEAQDQTGGTFTTVFAVSVRDGLDNPVSGATVTITNVTLGTVTLTEAVAGTGVYGAFRPSFPSGDFRLEVVRGTDNVRGVVLGGPGLHTITVPTANATVTAGQPMTVRWSVPTRAKNAELETRDFGPAVLPDTGAYTIPGINNPARTDQRIRVYRYNELDIAGGLSGSRMRVTVRNTVEPIVAQ